MWCIDNKHKQNLIVNNSTQGILHLLTKICATMIIFYLLYHQSVAMHDSRNSQISITIRVGADPDMNTRSGGSSGPETT